MNKIISVFFSGAAVPIEAEDLGITKYFLLSQVLHMFVQSDTNTNPDDNKYIAMGFDGTAISDGLLGLLFAKGIDRQCHEVIVRVKEEIQNGHHVTLNAYGHSRGGATALLLAKQLSNVDPSLLSIHLVLVDPVPGNLIVSTILDPFNFNLASKIKDLSECKPLKKVLALYPNQSLGWIQSFFAPTVSIYPAHTDVQEDVVRGNHEMLQVLQLQLATVKNKQGELRLKPSIIFQRDGANSSLIVFTRVITFLKTCGSQFNLPDKFKIGSRGPKFNRGNIYYEDRSMADLEKTLIETYSLENQLRYEAQSKSTHSSVRDISIRTQRNAPYFNLDHKKRAGGAEDAPVRLTLEKNRGLFTALQQATRAYPKTWLLLKMTVLSAAIATAIFFTGGFAAIPVVAGVAAKLGLLSIIAATPAVALSLTVLKKSIGWLGNKIAYPYYQMHTIEPLSKKISTNSTSTSTSTSSQVLAQMGGQKVSPDAIGEEHGTASVQDAVSSSPITAAAASQQTTQLITPVVASHASESLTPGL